MASTIVLGGCSAPQPGGDPIVVGPFTGGSTRYVLDSLRGLAWDDLRQDLDGDGNLDDALFSLLRVIEDFHDSPSMATASRARVAGATA